MSLAVSTNRGARARTWASGTSLDGPMHSMTAPLCAVRCLLGVRLLSIHCSVVRSQRTTDDPDPDGQVLR